MPALRRCRRLPPSATASASFLLLLTLVLLTCPTPLHGALVTSSDIRALTSHAVDDAGLDDVGPALYNATQTALTNAQAILSNYTTVLHGVAIPSGLTISFFGYFLLAPVLFLSAFVSGGGACFVATSTILSQNTPTDAWLSIGAMLLGGALLGFIAMRALPVGLFLVGASVGAVFASALRNSLIPKFFPDDPRTAFIVLAVSLGLILGVLAVIFEKHMLIFSTAYAGACAAVVGIGHFAGHFPSSHDLNDDVHNAHFDLWVVLYLLAAVALGTVGMLFQFWLVADKPMPEYAPYERRNRRRRRPRRSPSQWSDEDGDDWGGELYVERVPLPPPQRKRDFARTVDDKHDDSYVERRVIDPDLPVARSATLDHVVEVEQPVMQPLPETRPQLEDGSTEVRRTDFARTPFGDDETMGVQGYTNPDRRGVAPWLGSGQSGGVANLVSVNA